MLIEKEIKMKTEILIKYKTEEREKAKALASESIAFHAEGTDSILLVDESQPGTNPSVMDQQAADVVITLREMM